MSLSSEIANVSTTTTDVAVARIANANFVLVGSFSDPKTGVNQNTYRLAAGDSRYPLQLIMKVQDQGGQRRCSANISTYVKVDDSVSGVSDYYPINSLFAFNVPQALVDTADLGAFLSNVFGTLLGTVTTKVPDWSSALNLLFGIPKL